MKTSEHIRMEAFYEDHFPQELAFVLNWEMDDLGQYKIGFAKLAWAAWQAAQLKDFIYGNDEIMQSLQEVQRDSREQDIPNVCLCGMQETEK